MKIEIRVKMPLDFTVNLVKGRALTVEDLAYEVPIEEEDLLNMVYGAISKELVALNLPNVKSLEVEK